MLRPALLRDEANLAFGSIPKPQLLSHQTAIALFRLKIAPMATYGVQITSECLTKAQMASLDKLKANFLKRALGVHRSTKNRIAYLLTEAPLPTQQIKEAYHLPDTPAYQENHKDWLQKMDPISPDFYLTPATAQTWCKGPKIPQPHKITRGAAHGYHHLLCQRIGHHAVGAGCTCSLRNEPCEEHPLHECPKGSNFNCTEV